jgi:hypothetical protein
MNIHYELQIELLRAAFHLTEMDKSSYSDPWSPKKGVQTDPFGSVHVPAMSINRTALIAVKPSSVSSESDEISKRIFVIVPLMIEHRVWLTGTLATARVSACASK